MPATQSRGHAAPHRILHAIALAVMVAASAVAPVAASTASPVALRAQGSDPAPSSVKACSRSIQSRIDAAAAGSTVTVPACVCVQFPLVSFRTKSTLGFCVMLPES